MFTLIEGYKYGVSFYHTNFVCTLIVLCYATVKGPTIEGVSNVGLTLYRDALFLFIFMAGKQRR